MSLETKQIADITEADIETLKTNQVSERSTIEYKRDLPGLKDADRKEFLYDVSSFANARGGYLIFGIAEEGGVPTDIPGVACADEDGVIGQLQSLILNAVKPRMPGVELRFVKRQDANSVLLIQIPKSWSMPHMVTFQGVDRFYTRNSAGKHRVDVGELRAMFAQSGDISERLKRFRAERLSQIVAGETPVRLDPEPKLILHILPFEAFALGPHVDIKAARELSLFPLGEGGCNPRINIDGQLFYSNGFDKTSFAYLQLFRSGIIETVNARILSAGSRSELPQVQGLNFIPSIALEHQLLTKIPSYLATLQKLGIRPPFALMLTLLGVKDYWIAIRPGAGGGSKIDRDDLIVPEVLIESVDCKPKDLKPLIDTIWNAGGHPESPNFDASGNWTGRR